MVSQPNSGGPFPWTLVKENARLPLKSCLASRTRPKPDYAPAPLGNHSRRSPLMNIHNYNNISLAEGHVQTLSSPCLTSTALNHPNDPTQHSVGQPPQFVSHPDTYNLSSLPTKPLVIVKKEQVKPNPTINFCAATQDYSLTPAKASNLSPPIQSLRIMCHVKQPSESAALVDSESFLLLKDSIFDGYYRPSGSSESLSPHSVNPCAVSIHETTRVFHDLCDRHALSSSARNGTAASKTPPIRFPPAVYASPNDTNHLPGPSHPVSHLSTHQPIASITIIRMKEDDTGLPDDMLAILDELETLAVKVNMMDRRIGSKKPHDSIHPIVAPSNNGPQRHRTLQKNAAHPKIPSQHRYGKLYNALNMTYDGGTKIEPPGQPPAILRSHPLPSRATPPNRHPFLNASVTNTAITLPLPMATPAHKTSTLSSLLQSPRLRPRPLATATAAIRVPQIPAAHRPIKNQSKPLAKARFQQLKF